MAGARDDSRGEQEVAIPVPTGTVHGTLTVPEGAHGLVVFAHGSGSSRFSPRNRFVAGVLQQHGLATLLFDLLTAREEAIDDITRELRFDISLLTERLAQVIAWAEREPRTRRLPLGLFGSSTGAAAALRAAAWRPDAVSAVVSRGGRPDLAGDALGAVRAPTLLIVGGADDVVIELNQDALEQLTCEKELSIIPGATHLFEEPGTLDEVARQAAHWFDKRLGEQASPSAPSP